MRERCPGTDSRASRAMSYRVNSRRPPVTDWVKLAFLSALSSALIVIAPLPGASQVSPDEGGAAIFGSVADSHGNPVPDASVMLQSEKGSETTKTNVEGAFEFPALHTGNYSLSAEKANRHSQMAEIAIAENRGRQRVDLRLDGERSASSATGSASGSPPGQFEFTDNPDFQVAGVTDWTAVGGHGSDTTLRASEALAHDTLGLGPAKAPEGADENAQKSSADRHRHAGEREEQAGDPLAAVHEFEQAVQLDPSEENFFAWGSELLLHRAVWQAQEVFRNGAKAYPSSVRMLGALGAALFAGARYGEAAQFLCQASEVDPADARPYIFMGKVQVAAPDPLPCIGPKLARFAAERPDNSEADYLYAMAILKGTPAMPKAEATEAARKLLAKAVSIDPKCAVGYLELGILAVSSGDSAAAIDDLNRAIAADPDLSEAHYRLGVAYDRIGQAEKAKREFALHDQLEKQQADEAEQRRREIKQFLIVTPGEKETSPRN